MTGSVQRFLAALLGLLTLVLLPALPAAAEPFRIIVTEPETPLVPNSVIDLAVGQPDNARVIEREHTVRSGSESVEFEVSVSRHLGSLSRP